MSSEVYAIGMLVMGGVVIGVCLVALYIAVRP